MPIDRGMMHSAVRITSAGDLLGTGFLVTVPSETLDGTRWGYVVTAHHVIHAHIEREVQAPNPFVDGELYDPVPVEDWRQPLENVDVAIAPWTPRGTHHPAFPVELMIPTEVVAGMHLGSRIYYIGLFEPLMRPVVRSGTVAALDQDGVPHRRYRQPAHLVDCRSYRGFSGSPCLVEFSFAKLEQIPEDRLPWGSLPPEMWAGGESVPPLGGIAQFVLVCGMFVGHYSDEEAAGGVVSRYGVGVMVRSHEIKACLMTDEMREERL
ncbi:MAG TPA: serine protease, partial [Solirubrobacteraceae bacterium]|nr:serine protease [Solirubrobacteraceae bacterium]